MAPVNYKIYDIAFFFQTGRTEKNTFRNILCWIIKSVLTLAENRVCILDLISCKKKLIGKISFRAFKGATDVVLMWEKKGLSLWNHVSFYPSHHHQLAFPQWLLQAGCWSGLQAESFTRCCSDYCNICNINSRAGHQHSRPNSHDNEVTLSAQDKMTMMFLSQCGDYALYSTSHRARSCSG